MTMKKPKDIAKKGIDLDTGLAPLPIPFYYSLPSYLQNSNVYCMMGDNKNV